jgi:hypothetical protein
VFSALFWGIGPAAQLFPEMWASNSSELEDAATALRKENLIDDRAARALLERYRTGATAQRESVRWVSRRRLADFCYRQIAARDPGFFRRFQTEISSGDQRRVLDAFTDAAQRLNETLLVDGAARPDSRISGIAVNTNTFVNVDYAVNVHVALNIDMVKNMTVFWNKNFLDEASRFRSEVIVNTVSRRLATVRFAEEIR